MMDPERDFQSDMSRKRKLLAEQLGSLPLPKHNCWKRGHDAGLVLFLEEIPEIEDLGMHMIEGKLVAVPLVCSDLAESASDSNSIDNTIAKSSTMSVHSESKPEPEHSKVCSPKRSSASSATMRHYRSFNEPQSPVKVETEVAEKLSEDMDYILQEYVDCKIDKTTEKELINKVLCSATNSDLPIQEAQSNTQKPTIDQEFEEYFSSLLL